ncbi:MAG: NAD-dependent epimerase/dehydratase family protein [Candidatus Competibacterales bacterium]
MKTLVTGGGGFLGRYIVEQLLARGDGVTVYARGAYPELEALGVTVVRGDLGLGEGLVEALKDVEVVFHVAARPGLWGRYRDFYEPNVVGTERVIEACHRAGVARLVFTSSPSVVFDNHPHRGADESLPYPEQFESPYPATKALAEQRVLAANGPALATVSLRPHLIFGPRDRHLLPRVVARAKAGRLVQVGGGQNQVDLCYVEDAARAHLLALDALTDASSPVAGRAYFITQGEPVRLWPWLNALLARLDIPPVTRKVPLGVARAIGGTLEVGYRLLGLGGEPRLTRFLASELALDHYYSIDRARRDFGYIPQVTMEEGLERTLAAGLKNAAGA